MAFRTIGALVQLTSSFAKKSTGKPGTTAWTWFKLAGGPQSPCSYSRFAIQAVPASTVGTSAFTLTLVGSLTTRNPGALGSSKFTALLANYTSANLGAIVQTTKAAPIPCAFVGIRSTKFTTAAGRALRIFVAAIPA